MRTAWTNGTEENLFPLQSNIAFTQIINETKKSFNCLEVCSSCKFSINFWMLFQYINQNA